MPDLYLVSAQYAHVPRSLRVVRELEPGSTRLFSISDDGEVTSALDEKDDPLVRLRRELRRPSGLIELIESEGGESRWQAAGLLLAAWEAMNARGALGLTADRWTRTLLLALQARASLRAFASADDADPGWNDRAARDLLDAAAALEFFDSRRLAPSLQWLVAVLPRERARVLIDDLLPVDDRAFVRRIAEPAHRELRRVVQAVAEAQRRQYFLGRYDLRGAGRLRDLLGRVRHPGSLLRAWTWRAWLLAMDRLVPRLLAGCVVGILPFLMTDEAWRLISDLPVARVAALSLSAAVLVLVYLFYDRDQADPAGLSPSSGVVSVWLTVCLESLILAAGVQWLAAPSFQRELEESARFNDGVFLASAAFALGVGVFTQLIWQEKAVTAPP